MWEGLRRQALDLTAEELGTDVPDVYGFVMDMAYRNGTATLVAMSDGATSLYTSTGGGIIGAGSHASARQANEALLGLAAEHRDLFPVDPSAAPPPVGSVTMRLLTQDGRLAITEREDALGTGSGPLSSVFHAAHGVLTALRLLDEARG